MNEAVVLAAVLTLLCCLDTASSDTGNLQCGRLPQLRRHKRIIGYELVHNESSHLPWVAALRIARERGLHCTSSIISRFHVLTAAHCAHRTWKTYDATRREYVSHSRFLRPDEFVVYPGSPDWTRATVARRVHRITFHPDFLSTNLDGLTMSVTCNDIAIMELSEPLQWTDHVQPICLPNVKFREPKGGTATVAGWGRLGSARGVLSPWLRTTNVKFEIFGDKERISTQVRKNTAFKKFMVAITRKRTYCPASIYASSFGHGVDQGDSGGPMMIVEDGSWTQVGVDTGSKRPWQKNFQQVNPVVATRITAYCAWIRNATRCAAACKNDAC